MNPTRRLAQLLALVCMASGFASTAGAVEHSAFDSLLAAAVRGERLDYRLIERRWKGTLDAYLGRLAATDVAALARNEQLALYLNLYNATMIRAVLDRAKSGWSPAADDFAVFDEPLVKLGTRAISLNQLETDVIQKEFEDPRIHAALVCASLGCPPLLPRAYRAADLDATLEANMRRFVRDTTRNRIDDRARVLHLSSLFDWYAEDFGGKEALPAYVSRYLGRDVEGYAVKFLEYDWRLNAAHAAH